MIDVINFEIKEIEYGNAFNVDSLVIFSSSGSNFFKTSYFS